MSIEALSKFCNAVKIDPSLKEKIEQEANISLEKLTAMNLQKIEAANNDYLSSLIKIATEYGYYFTEEELKAQIARYSSSDRQLDDDSLDDAVGGVLESRFGGYNQSGSDRSQNSNGWLMFDNSR